MKKWIWITVLEIIVGSLIFSEPSLFLKGIYLIKTNQVELGKKECSKAMRICKEYNDSDTIEKLNKTFKSDFII